MHWKVKFDHRTTKEVPDHSFIIIFAIPFFDKWTSQVVLVEKNPPANTGDIRNINLIPGSGRFSGKLNGNLLQYSCLENPMNRGIWRAPVCRVAKSWTILKWLSTHTVFDKYCFALPGITILGTELEYWVWNEWMDYTKLGIAQRWACEFWLHQHPAAWPREYSFSWLCFFPLAY